MVHVEIDGGGFLTVFISKLTRGGNLCFGKIEKGLPLSTQVKKIFYPCGKCNDFQEGQLDQRPSTKSTNLATNGQPEGPNRN